MAFSFVYFGGRGPFVNEVHYLAKAKHFWNTQWCQGDPFLESSNAHVGFCAATGWLTRLVPLPTAALIWRFISWVLIAAGWRKLCRVIGIGELDAFLAFGLTVSLVADQHLAGEWFLGGVEGKPFSYGFVLIALAFILQQRWYSAWLRAAWAVFFHPVVGGWTVLGLGTVGLAARRSKGQPHQAWNRWIAPSVALATILTLMGIVPVLVMHWQTPREDVEQATQIHVHERLPHHLVLHRMATQNQVRFGVLVALWCVMAWQERRQPTVWPLHLFVAYTVLLTFVGLLIELATWNRPEVSARWLQFYWFRMSDIFVPVGIALGAFVAALQRSDRSTDILRIAILILLMIGVTDHFMTNHRDPRPPADRQGQFGLPGTLDDHLARHQDWKELGEWAREHTDPHALFLTPIHSQTFKWYAERPELVTWKDCPQDARGILRWHQLMKDVQALGLYRGAQRPDVGTWEKFARDHDVDYIIVLRELDPETLPLPHVFRNNTFDVYRVSS